MLSDALQSAYTRTRWGVLLRALVSLALGVFILAKPMDSVAAFALVIAIWALFAGLAHVVDSIEMRAVLPHWWLLLLSGLISIGFGIAALYYYPILSLTFAVFFFAWWLLLTGFVSIYVAILERRMGVSYIWPLLVGVLSVVAGVYAVMVPGITLAAIIGLIGGFAIAGGILLLIGFYKLGAAKARLADVTGTARA